MSNSNCCLKSDFKEYQKRLVDLLFFFDKLCRDNDIKYTVLDGTMLGAVRHKGMIPWDGDVDVAVTPKELEKLKTVFHNLDSRYYLNYIPNHSFKAKGRKYDYSTLVAKVIDTKCSSGIFGLDVFTIDFLGDDYDYAKETIRIYKCYHKYSRFFTSLHIPPLKVGGRFNIKGIVVFLLYPILYIISKLFTPVFEASYLRFRNKRIDSNSEQCKYFTIQPYLNRFGIEENTLLKDGYMDIDFEHSRVMIARNYEVYLRTTYGDYMKLPPKDNRKPYPSEEFLTNCIFE